MGTRAITPNDKVKIKTEENSMRTKILKKLKEIKNNARDAAERGEGHLKNCPAMGKTCKNCNKPNHFAKMYRSQQVKEITNEGSSSEEECNLIQTFDS